MQSSIQFRLAQTNDLAAIVENESKTHINPWSQTQLQQSISGSEIVWVVESQNISCLQDSQKPTLLGHMIVMSLVDEWELLNLVVTAEYQGQGIGRLWLQFLFEQAVKQKIAKIFLEVRESNAAAISLYHKFGFSEIGRRKNYYSLAQGHEDALLMGLQLDITENN